MAYAAANVLAAAMVLISLTNAFNIASFLIQVSFILIGLVGIIRKLRLRNGPGTCSVNRKRFF